jgi:hypothetical protein
LIIKRDIVKELEERKKKIRENEFKSKKMKAQLIKLDPIASKEERVARQKEAK